eukprot:CAMPEP_0172491274 /NCGR_PEP_ID=MMETSP1066-20121228/22009_1 /TAXON_ID=671091 /ORGANISM="Coscinodiscus wailesii, Strain CCMP2513" /LENGTH=401 /DNA_ID=CAMNT_0013260221 /DNA_START=73 /DNA_END=1278 /DNA_ORIENTATION=-
MSDTKEDVASTSDKVVPVIDLGNSDESVIVKQIATACAETGAFQVINHGICASLINDHERQRLAFFELPHFPSKSLLYRYAGNARGYMDHDFTKQRRDWKECLDIGIPGSRDWNLADDDERNACLDGFNRFPSDQEIAGFRSITIKYFQAVEDLCYRISVLMVKGLGVETTISDGVDGTEKSLLSMLKEENSSYLRLNHYPPRCLTVDKKEDVGKGDEKHEYYGIHPHSDSGFLTLLAQDPNCLTHEVSRPGGEDDWVAVQPAPQSFTILTGDMVMLWSNKKYISAWHRVLTHPVKHRYSTLFFYNPGYNTTVSPCKELTDSDGAEYVPCSYGYFRAVKYAGDLADLGREIFVWDYEVGSDSKHPETQKRFLEGADLTKPFNVQNYRKWIQSKEEDTTLFE